MVIDEREKSSGVPEELEALGTNVSYRVLDVADYLIGEYAIERKSIRDFIKSVFDGRLFDQAYRLGSSYERVILIVEGDISDRLEDLENPRWFWGGLISAVMDYEMKCFFTPDPGQTAQLIYTLGRKSEKDQKGLARPHDRRPPLIVRKPRSGELDRVQTSIVSALPGVGPKLGRQLLDHFGSVRRVFEASATDMAIGAGIGRGKALALRKVLDADYKRKEKQVKFEPEKED
ncbi:MAG TPA: ERCC4 domain-containing protein [Candidatus Binatus sp.]|nr:ERCC4 domain-containing protein [Candidatus Binatus sp.]